MITVPEILTSAYLYITECGTQGYSSSAKYIAEKVNNSYRELGRPEFYFSIKNKVLPELEDVFINASNEGWDSFNALPIRRETYLQAIKFLESLANDLPIPTVGVESDGNITFEWYKSPHRLLLVSINSFGELHYAALIGQNKSYGTEILSRETPKVITDIIYRVTLA